MPDGYDGCLSKCFGFILGLDDSETPKHLTKEDDPHWIDTINDQLNKFGFYILSVARDWKNDNIFYPPRESVCIALGEVKGINHAVVWHKGESIFDPYGVSLTAEPEYFLLLIPYDPKRCMGGLNEKD